MSQKMSPLVCDGYVNMRKQELIDQLSFKIQDNEKQRLQMDAIQPFFDFCEICYELSLC